MANVIDISGGMTGTRTGLTAQELLARELLKGNRGPSYGVGDSLSRLASQLGGAFFAKQGEEQRAAEQTRGAQALMQAAALTAGGRPGGMQSTGGMGGDQVADVPAIAPGMAGLQEALRIHAGNPGVARSLPTLLQVAQASEKQAPKAPEGMRFNAQGGLENIPGFADAKGQQTAAGWKPIDRLQAEAQAGRETPQEAAQRAGAIAAAQTPYQIQAARAGRETPQEAAAKAAAIEQAKMQANPTAGNKQAYELEGKLRDDFNQFQPVKSFRQAAPIITSMREAVNRNTAGADLNLVYGIAKIFDPDSVVREGEMVLVKSTANLPAQVEGYLSFVMGGGRLTPEIRANLMQEAESRYSAYKSGYDAAATSVQAMAARMGVNPENVIMGGLTPDARPNVPKAPTASAPAAPAEKKPEEMSMEELKAKLGIK